MTAYTVRTAFPKTNGPVFTPMSPCDLPGGVKGNWIWPFLSLFMWMLPSRDCLRMSVCYRCFPLSLVPLSMITFILAVKCSWLKTACLFLAKQVYLWCTSKMLNHRWRCSYPAPSRRWLPNQSHLCCLVIKEESLFVKYPPTCACCCLFSDS